MRNRPCNSGESGVEIAVIMGEYAFLATRMTGDGGRSGSRTIEKGRVMATYGDGLKDEQLGQMNDAIEAFLDSYAQHRGSLLQRTVIFFPGGMGSELVRARIAYNPKLPTGSYGFDTVWVDLVQVIVDESALLLQMNGEQDSNDKFIVAHGPLSNCALHPYDNLAAWCTANNLDLLMVGWDFRRDADWNVDFFLNLLVPAVKQRAADRGWSEDPFHGATIVGHSFGGMVAKWILNKHDHPFCRDLRLAITVATPFYGSPGQTERLFTSEPALGPFYNLDEITTTIATLPGGYSLFFLDGDTFDTHCGGLLHDKDAPLDRYPSWDRTDANVRVDPYAFPADNPANPNLCRYPIRNPNPAHNWPWFGDYLAKGLCDYQGVASPLDASVRGKFHNIRCIQTSGRTDMAATKIMQRWNWYDVTRNRMPQASGVIETFGGPGDGVIPAWSGRLVTQDPANIHTIRGETTGPTPLEHMALMNHPAVRGELIKLIVGDQAAQIVVTPAPEPASIEDFNEVKARIEGVARSKTFRLAKEVAQEYLMGLPPAQQQALARRWFIELPKGAPPTYQRLP
jgi:pimeloyl-ACP methyl ester carboxylesterase